MPSLTLDKKTIWFAHCPKAGGTSVERFMVDTWGSAVGHLFWGWDIWWKAGGWRQAGPPCSPQHLIWEDARKLLPDTPDQVFAIVRDPVARLVSEYRYQRQARRGTIFGRILAHLPFSLWLDLVLSLSARNPYAFDNHLRPQSDFIPESARIFYLENGMEAVARWFTEATGANVSGGCFSHELKLAAGPPVDVRDRDIALIHKVFAQDYSRFGYGNCSVESGLNYITERAFLRWRDTICNPLLRLLTPGLEILERCGKL